MILHDFECECGHSMEELVKQGEVPICPRCKKDMKLVVLKTPLVCTTIIPTYPGCKRKKAGYTHTNHADHPATKIQSGYGGCVSPKNS